MTEHKTKPLNREVEEDSTICSYCGNVFNHLNRHEVYVDGDIIVLKCPHCSKVNYITRYKQ
jgi:uncharacterized Zn-finger protein